jgi:hypothetical protein
MQQRGSITLIRIKQAIQFSEVDETEKQCIAGRNIHSQTKNVNMSAHVELVPDISSAKVIYYPQL